MATKQDDTSAHSAGEATEPGLQPLGKPEPLAIDTLRLDAGNPRIAELVAAETELSQEDLLTLLWKYMAVDELALSMAANGYFPNEELYAQPGPGGTWIVVEGNRRLAAAQLLRSPSLVERLGLEGVPMASASVLATLEKLPVVKLGDRRDAWRYLGFKHVNGQKTWGSYSKAQYIGWVHDTLGVPLDEIAKTIGDQHATAKRLYRGIRIVLQAEQRGVWYRKHRSRDHFAFSHLYTGLGYSGIQSFLGIDPEVFDTTTPVPEDRLQNLGELATWLWGDKSRDADPEIRSQNPDLRILDEVLQNDRGIAALRNGLGLDSARDLARGAKRNFHDALVSALTGLRESQSFFVGGFDGDRQVLALLEEVFTEARDLHHRAKSWQVPGDHQGYDD